MSYRLPARGDAVEVAGVRGRPQLNGAVGRVTSAGVDDRGRVTVHVGGAGGEEDSGARDMRIKLCHLRPAKAPLAVSLPDLLPTSGSRAASSTGCRTPKALGSQGRLLEAVPRSGPPSAFTHHSRAESSRSHGTSCQSRPFTASARVPGGAPGPPRSKSSPGLDMEARRAQYQAELADWKRERAGLGDEFGIRWHKPTSTSDVTNYFKVGLIQSGGIPAYKANVKEEVTLMDVRLGVPVPMWK